MPPKKMHFNEEERSDSGEAPVQEFKRRPTLDGVVREVTRGLWMKEFTSVLEPLLRKTIREELERGIVPLVHSFPRSPFNQLDISRSRGLQLHFQNKLQHTLFTNNRVEAEDGAPIQIVVLDTITKRIVSTGPLSLIKVEILVLDGDFGFDAKEDWSKEEFDACVIRERDGKRPLVTGDLQITTRDGIGYLGDITFTDNSSWTRSRRFRLGARVVGTSCNFEGIREARSEAFIVKDHRGVLYQKHHPPSLSDEVWRLEKIGKDGAFHKRLACNEINTVQDLLRLLVTDPSCLRSILSSGMSNKTWKTIVQHAKSCILDKRRYIYNSVRQVGLIFDSVYELMGATFDGQSYESLQNLTASQMILVEGLKHRAYRNPTEIVEIDWPLVEVSSGVLPVQISSFPSSSPGQPAAQASHSSSINALPYMLDDPGWLEEFSVTQDYCPVQFISSNRRNSFKMKGHLASYANDLNQWDPGESSQSVVVGESATGDASGLVQLPDCLSLTASWGQGNGNFLDSEDEMGIDIFSDLPDISINMTRSSKRNIRWIKIAAAVKWVIFMRDVAARRRLGY